MPQGKSNTREIRKINRSIVFQFLYRHPHITKQELALGCDLSMPTVSLNLADLQRMGLLETSGVKDSTGGRRARLLSVNPSARYALGVNVTAHHITCVLLNLYGQMICRERISIAFSNSQAYMQVLADLLRSLIHSQGIDREHILGVGLSMPAIISKDGESLAYASVLNFTDGRLQDFSVPIGLPCRFINDATAGGFAELWHNPIFSQAGSPEAVVYLSLNNSVGGAFFISGREYAGENQRASEFGHISLYAGGRQCYCGKLGCADAYLRALNLSDLCDGSLTAFFEQLRQNNQEAENLWRQYCVDLARCVNTLRMAYDCQIIVGGSVGEHLAPYLTQLRAQAAALNTFENDGSYLHVSTDKLENSAAGAALMWISDFTHIV